MIMGLDLSRLLYQVPLVLTICCSTKCGSERIAEITYIIVLIVLALTQHSDYLGHNVLYRFQTFKLGILSVAFSLSPQRKLQECFKVFV